MHENDFPNYVKLFGQIDFREADETRSVYSPAAYLTDLLQLIDDQFDDSTNIYQRRGDIQKLLLDAENTSKLLPYLDIVNEVLEKNIKTNADQDAYDLLKEANYPFNLPFHLERDRIALYEKYLSITPEEFHKAFIPFYDKDSVVREYIGLSEEESAVIVSETDGDALRLL